MKYFLMGIKTVCEIIIIKYICLYPSGKSIPEFSNHSPFGENDTSKNTIFHDFLEEFHMKYLNNNYQYYLHLLIYLKLLDLVVLHS